MSLTLAGQPLPVEIDHLSATGAGQRAEASVLAESIHHAVGEITVDSLQADAKVELLVAGRDSDGRD